MWVWTELGDCQLFMCLLQKQYNIAVVNEKVRRSTEIIFFFCVCLFSIDNLYIWTGLRRIWAHICYVISMLMQVMTLH